MFLLWKRRRKAQKALHNPRLQKALKNASAHHFEKFSATKDEIPWEEYKAKAREIRENCLKILPQLIEKFRAEAEKAGARTYEASTPQEALRIIASILEEKKARLVVKAKSMVSEEIELNRFLEKKGIQTVETDLGEQIIQLAGEKPSHMTAPALHKTKEEIAELFSLHFGKEIPPDPKEIVKTAREEMRKIFMEADAGISGANFAVAESGTLVLVSNEGNARLATSLPPVHIALITAEKFVDTLEHALTLVKALVPASSGHKMTAYVSLITGPSRTTDIEKELVIGAHGPQEVHIIILDNGRLKILNDKHLNSILYCLKCGGCMLVCPVFQALGGHVFGGPVYPGGVGLLMTAVTHSRKDAVLLSDFCADCKRCEDFCPVGIPSGELLLHLKGEEGPRIWESFLSGVFGRKSLLKTAVKTSALLLSPWKNSAHLQRFPFIETKEKALSPQTPEKSPFIRKERGKKIYLFEGCLGKLFFPEIRESISSSLAHFGFNVACPPDQECCGAPSLHLGDVKTLKKLALKNLQSFIKENPDFILTFCPTGNSLLKTVYPSLSEEFAPWAKKVFDFSEFVVREDLLEKQDVSLQSEEIFYHYPCHYIYNLKLNDEPKKLLQNLGFRVKTENEPLACCGFCGVFSLKNPKLSAHMWKKKQEKIRETNAATIATDCPGCLLQIKSHMPDKPGPLKIVHTAELLRESLNLDYS